MFTEREHRSSPQRSGTINSLDGLFVLLLLLSLSDSLVPVHGLEVDRLLGQPSGLSFRPVLATVCAVDLVAPLPFRKRAFWNSVVVVIVVWIAGVVMKCPNGVRRDTLFQFFHFQSYLVFHRFFLCFLCLLFYRLSGSVRMNRPVPTVHASVPAQDSCRTWRR